MRQKYRIISAMKKADKKPSVLVVGSEGHQKAEKCVAWGVYAYIGDYDLVIFNTASLSAEVIDTILTTDSTYFSKLKDMVLEAQVEKRLKIFGLLSPRVFGRRTGSEGRVVSNYDFFPIIPILEELPGNKLSTEKTSKTLKYFSKIRNWERLYSDFTNNTPYDFARRRAAQSQYRFSDGFTAYVVNSLGRAVAFGFSWRVYNLSTVQIQGGESIFVPLVEDVAQSVDLIIDEFLEEEEPRPVWLDSVLMPGEESVIADISEIEDESRELGMKKNEKLGQLGQLNEYKKILYTKGKSLEGLVDYCFQILGVELLSPPVANEEDRYFEEGESKIPIEIRGKNNEALNGKDLNQLISRIPDKTSGELTTLGIFIINHYKDLPPAERPKPFEDNLIKKALACDICLMTALDVFNLVVEKMEGLNTDNLASVLFNTKGVFDVSRYIEDRKKDAKDKEEKLVKETV